MRAAIIAAILTVLALLIGGAGAQQNPAAFQTLEHGIRLNRVWTMNVKFDTCGVKIDQVFLTTILEDGQLGETQQARTDRISLQWTRDVEGERGYTLIDLLADLGQKIYLIRVHGSNPFTGGQFVKFYWISPFGISDKSLMRAPLRPDVSEVWRSEELDHIKSWFMSHKWTHPRLLDEFEKMMWKRDVRIDVPMKFVKEGCREASLDEESEEGDLQ